MLFEHTVHVNWLFEHPLTLATCCFALKVVHIHISVCVNHKIWVWIINYIIIPCLNTRCMLIDCSNTHSWSHDDSATLNTWIMFVACMRCNVWTTWCDPFHCVLRAFLRKYRRWKDIPYDGRSCLVANLNRTILALAERLKRIAKGTAIKGNHEYERTR
jgi:hypothetical protein